MSKINEQFRTRATSREDLDAAQERLAQRIREYTAPLATSLKAEVAPIPFCVHNANVLRVEITGNSCSVHVYPDARRDGLAKALASFRGYAAVAYAESLARHAHAAQAAADIDLLFVGESL